MYGQSLLSSYNISNAALENFIHIYKFRIIVFKCERGRVFNILWSSVVLHDAVGTQQQQIAPAKKNKQ